jgi:glycosyltransferase involved in cell wall biosynthesis
VISVSQRGYGSALRAGIEAARGEWVVMGDADDSYDFLAIGPFVEALRNGASLVMGNRFAGRIASSRCLPGGCCSPR